MADYAASRITTFSPPDTPLSLRLLFIELAHYAARSFSPYCIELRHYRLASFAFADAAFIYLLAAFSSPYTLSSPLTLLSLSHFLQPAIDNKYFRQLSPHTIAHV